MKNIVSKYLHPPKHEKKEKSCCRLYENERKDSLYEKERKNGNEM